MGAAFVLGIVFPRADQEARAGGAFSWNTGIDYAAQLKLSGRRAMIEALYRKAGLSLDADLAKLAAAPRIAAKPGAVDYMLRHYTPTARPRVPLISLQAIGDGMTSPSLQRSYVEAANPRMVRGLWQNAAGHCRQPVEVAVTALHYLEARLDRGRWPKTPVSLVPHSPAPMLRPCLRGRTCK